MRILELLLAPMTGGAETLVAGLTREFSRQGHEVVVVFLDPAPSVLQQEFADILFDSRHTEIAQIAASPPWRRFRRVARLIGTRSLIRLHGYDIIHTHTYIPNGYGRVAALLAHSGASVVTTHHSASGIRGEYESKSSQILERALLRTTEAVVTVNEEDRGAVHELFGFPASRIVCIPNGLPRAPIAKTVATATPRQFIAVSRLAPQKDISTLLKGFDLYAKQQVDQPTLRIAGPWCSADYKKEIEQILTDLGNPPHIMLMGTRTDVPRLLAESDVYVSASKAEGHPISVLEAAAAGLPTLLSSIPPHKLLDHAAMPQASVYFAPGDAQALADSLETTESDWIRLSANALIRGNEVSQGYSIAACANSYLSLFRNLLR